MFLTLAVAAAVGVVAWRMQPAAPSFERVELPTPAQSVGVPVADVYRRDCATCHGNDARGTDLGPDLRGSGTALLDYVLATGRMPLRAPDSPVRRSTARYDGDTIRALVRYVHRLAGGGAPIPDVDPARGDLARGGTLFRLNCAACHAWSGEGGALHERQAPSLHPATPLQVAEAVRSGPLNMPSFGEEALDRHDLDSVVRYVRSIDHPDDRGGAGLWHLGPLAEGAVAIFLGLGALVVVLRWIGTRA